MKMADHNKAARPEVIRQMVDRNPDSEKAKQRFLDRIRRAPDRHARDVIRWSREELHER